MLRSLLFRLKMGFRKVSRGWRSYRLKFKRIRDKEARGVANCLVPCRKSDRADLKRERLIGKTDDPDRVKSHFNYLSNEVDPMEYSEEIPDDSVRKVTPNISVEDVKNRILEARDHNAQKDAKSAIRGCRPWPVPPPTPRKRKS